MNANQAQFWAAERFQVFRPSAAPIAAPGREAETATAAVPPRERAGMPTPTRPVPAPRLPEAEGERGPAWAAEARSRVESCGAGGGTHRELFWMGGPMMG